MKDNDVASLMDFLPAKEAMDERTEFLKKVEAQYESFNEDDKKYAFKLFTVIGFSYLFSCFALLQPVDYWRLIFPTFNAVFEIAWVYNIASVSTLLFLVWCGASPSYVERIVGGYATIVLFMIALPVSHFVLDSQNANLVMVLGSTAIISIAISTIDSTLLSLASLFPVGAMENTQVGMGFALFVSALYRVVTKAFFPSELVVAATMLYFGITVATVAAGLVAFFLLLRLPMTQHYIHHVAKSQVIDRGVWGKIWFKVAMIATSFGCTYVVYPGVVSSIPSYNFPSLNSTGWWPLILMTIFAGFEATGRSCVRWRMTTHETIWTVVLPRLLLLPLLILSAKGKWLAHDAISLVLVMLLGWSNGYCGTLAVVVLNDCVDDHEQSVTGMFASLAINVGILSGATVSLLVAYLLGV
ncbi:hypothetical protein AeMF1_006895 [Aphanomyces euteiches]|nr:hypothetical protein AeMF1_006895 [Aphanomyces euteiches]